MTNLAKPKWLLAGETNVDDVRWLRENASNVDMSPHAITVRLRRVSQLRRLCLALAKAKPVESPE
jgi:hypothetical protein